MEDIKKIVGERLREARERKNLKQNKVARMLGIHNSTLAKYESGEREADYQTLIKLSDIYEVKVDWLTGSRQKGDKPLITNDQAKNAVLEIYTRLPPDKKKIIDDMIKALGENK